MQEADPNPSLSRARAVGVLLALALTFASSIMMLNAWRAGTPPPCGSFVGCELALNSGLYRAFGVQSWILPLFAVPMAIVLLLGIGGRGATIALAVAAGVAMKSEWNLYRLGWACPWCSLATAGLVLAALLSIGLPRFRPSLSAWGVAVMILGAPLAYFRSPGAPVVKASPNAPMADKVEAIPRVSLTGSDDQRRGFAVFIGDPLAPGTRERVVPWAKGRLAAGRRLVFRRLSPVEDMRNVTASLLLTTAWRKGVAEWPALFHPQLDATALQGMANRFGSLPKEALKERVAMASQAIATRLMGFKNPPILIDCAPDDVCRRVEPALVKSRK